MRKITEVIVDYLPLPSFILFYYGLLVLLIKIGLSIEDSMLFIVGANMALADGFLTMAISAKEATGLQLIIDFFGEDKAMVLTRIMIVLSLIFSYLWSRKVFLSLVFLLSLPPLWNAIFVFLEKKE